MVMKPDRLDKVRLDNRTEHSMKDNLWSDIDKIYPFTLQHRQSL